MSFKQIFRIIVVTVSLFLALFYYQAYSLYKRSVVAQKWVMHTNLVINKLENVYAGIWQLQGAKKLELNQVSRQRVITDVHRNIDALTVLVKDNPGQRKRVGSLSVLINNKLNLLSRQQTLEVTDKIYLLDDQIKSSIGILIGVENNLLNERSQSYEYYSERRFIFSLVSFSLLGIFLFISLSQIFRSLVRRNKAERIAQAHEHKYKRLIESSQFTTAIVGLDKKIKFISSNVEQLSGRKKEDVIGTEISIPMPTVEGWKQNNGINFVDTELKINHQTEGERWIAYRIFPLYDETGEIEEWQVVAWDIDSERKMREELSLMSLQQQQQQKLMQDIIDNIPSAVYIKDVSGKYVIVNKKFCEIWNRKPEDILGRRDVEIFADQVRRDNYQVADQQVLQHKSMVTLEDTMARDGQIDHFWIIKFPLLDDKGEVQNICGLATDITERKENEFKLLKATRAAESARIAQESFLANMSHEIRTPMNGIMGMSNLLLSTIQTGEQKEYAESILESARHLLAIINDILDFSKIKAGKFHLENISFKPRHVVKKAIYPLQFKADEKMVRLKLEMEDGVPEVAIGDPLRLQQIIINLVGNALKFTERGSVQVTVTCKELTRTHCHMQVLVKDTGIGIAQDKLQMIFESFTQNNVNTSRKYGGTGLGLAIVKQLVEMQKGRVWVESTPGEGSVFGFVIPYAIGKLPEMVEVVQPTYISEDDKLLTGINVLVAEDNLINQKVVNITLKKQGAEVKITANGREAVETLKQGNYDVILMDLQMPEMDGYNATRMIRREINASIPIIAMTADALKGEAERCFEAGMNGYISKPFEPKDLYQEILSFTRKKDNMQQEDNNDLPPVDLTYLYELSGHDPVYINEVLDLFLGTMNEGMDQLAHLVKETDDWDGIYRQAHFLKSSVSVVQVRDMFENLARIEQAAQQKEGKEEMLRVLAVITDMYRKAHPILVAEKAKNQAGKI